MNIEKLRKQFNYLYETNLPLCQSIEELISAYQVAVAPSSGGLQKYKRKPGNEVQAIQLMESAVLNYSAWGGDQQALGGDWLVRRKDGETYTVEQKSFAATYAETVPRSGWYDKHAPVWAEVATTADLMPTKEGSSSYAPGFYLCYNSADHTDGWCMPTAKFEALYELDTNS